MPNCTTQDGLAFVFWIGIFFMAENKKSFILYADLIHTVSKLPNEKAGELFKHILDYVNDKNPHTEDLIIQISFEPIKQQLKRDLQKWEGELSKKSEGGALGNLKRWNVDLYNKVVSKELNLNKAIKIASSRSVSHTDGIPSHTIASVAVNVNDNVTVNVNDNEDIEERKSDFSEPTVIFTSTEIKNEKEKKVAPKKESENEVVIYPIEQIQQRLSEWEYELIENSCKVLKITVDEYKAGVEIFIFEQGDGLKKDYSEVKKHFRSWLKINVTNIRKSLNNKNLPNGKPQKIGGIDIKTLERNHATIEDFKRKEQDSGNNDW